MENKEKQLKPILNNHNRKLEVPRPDFKSYYRTVIIKAIQYWHKNRNIDQWNRIEGTDIIPHTYGHLTFYREAKNIDQKKRASSPNGGEQLDS